MAWFEGEKRASTAAQPDCKESLHIAGLRTDRAGPVRLRAERFCGCSRLLAIWLRFSPRWARIATAIGLMAAFAPAAALAQAPCPSPVPRSVPPPNLIAPAATLVPDDVCIAYVPTARGLPSDPISYFDSYSWLTFIALVWPAMSGQRGVPDPTQPITPITATQPNSATYRPLVFETYKADWETFQPGGAPPSDFNSNASFWTSNPAQSPCPQAKPGDFLLAPVPKFGNVGLARFGELASVLIAQNGTFVRYLAAYNQTEFNQIQANELYLAAKLPQHQNPVGPNIVFQNGALSVKSAWIDMRNVPNPQRYHTRPAWLVDPISNKCSDTPVTVGLVGLHIVQKTPIAPQWIWSTFEQIDNVPPPDYVQPMPPARPTQTFTFNDGTTTAMPTAPPTQFIWSNARNATAPPAPVNIQRLTPVHPNTATTNVTWQNALKAQNSVWQFYQLTMTQWPVPQSTPGPIQHSFPGTANTGDDSTAYANTTLETWDQTDMRLGFGCMSCHNHVHNNDFVWSLQMNAFPQAALAARPPSPAETALRSLLQQHIKQ